MLATAMLKSSKTPAVGIDLGGTTIKAALGLPELEVLGHEAVPTDVSSQAALLDSIVELVGNRVRAGTTCAGVGFGLPSQVNQLTGEVVDSTNVPIADVAFKEEMGRRLGLPVELDNDANVACLAETLVGAARGLSHVIMLTLGTGVGGGIVADGEIYRGATGYGGELGHMVVDENGPPLPGPLPQPRLPRGDGLGRGRDARRRRDGRRRTPAGRSPAMRGRRRARCAPRDRPGARPAIPSASRRSPWSGRHLGVGIASYINIFNPQAVVIGGGISSAGELILRPGAGRGRVAGAAPAAARGHASPPPSSATRPACWAPPR